MRTRAARIVAAAVTLAAAASVLEAQPAAPSAPLQLLDVPYLPQSEDLCGGAAAAMVMRYWGATGVYAETFAELVSRDAGGIRAEDLLRAVRSRGWDAQAFRGDTGAVQAHLDRRRPVVVLLEDRPGRFHYVVVVGWHAGKVFLHDPARSPFRILDQHAFGTAWQAAGFWTLVLLPSAEPAAAAAPGPVLAEPPPATPNAAAGLSRRSPAVSRAKADPCRAMVEEGVRLAGAGDKHAARELLQAAVAACPAAAAPWRELAGLHALERAWRQAAAHAREAVSRDRHDRHAWRLLATSLYLERDDIAALEAWNHLDEPVVDLIDVSGLERTRYSVAARALGLRPRTLLTPDALRAAERRLSEMPAAQIARVTYRPAENGMAHVDATVVERPLFPASPAPLAATAMRLATDRELSLSLANPTRGGEVWTASWRWWDRRPRVALGFAAPGAAGGVWRVEAFDDRQAYGDEHGTIAERRRAASVGFSHWLTGSTRIMLGAGIDKWRGRGRAMSVRGEVRQHAASGTIEITVRSGTWLGSTRTWTAGIEGEWRSSLARQGHVWIARAGIDSAGTGAPLALWAGAGSGQGRDPLLRAHPLLVDGVIRNAVFGRRLVHGGGEWRRWARLRGLPLRIAPAVFVDLARAFEGLPASDMRAHVDAGAGLRLALPGGGAIRIDAARGLRDGKMVLSLGWTN